MKVKLDHLGRDVHARLPGFEVEFLDGLGGWTVRSHEPVSRSELALRLRGLPVEVAPDERAAFLDRVSDGDVDVRRELESLLAAHEQREAYTEKPPDDIAAGYLAQQGGGPTTVPALAANTRLDHYEIRSLLG